MVVQKGKQEEGAVLGELSEGGGLFGSNGVDVEWIKLRYQIWEYPDKSTTAPVLMITMKTEDGEEHEEPYTCGGLDFWKPSKDGHKIIPISTATTISSKSKTGLLTKSLLEADYPEENENETGLKQIRDCTILEGLCCHMIRQLMPKGSIITPKKPRADGRVFEDTYLAVDKIIKFPWEGKTEIKEKEEIQDKIAGKVTAAILEILEANPKGLQKQKLAGQVFTKLKGDPDAMAAAQLANKDEFLKDRFEWGFEKGIVKPSEEDVPF